MTTTKGNDKMITWQEWMLEVEELYQQARKAAE
jgi:hypothetical protein